MKFAKSFYTLTLLLLCCSMAYSQNAGQVRKLKTELGKITGSKEFKTATIGFCVMDVETGKVLVETNSEKSLIPASTMKLITTGAGLALLGDTFRFKTELEYMGDIKNGELHGRLLFSGNGDPTIGSKRWNSTNIDTIFSKLYAPLKSLGIKKFRGDVITYNPYYLDNNTPPDYNVGDVKYQYGAAPSSINIFDNVVNENTEYAISPSLLDPNQGKYYFFIEDYKDDKLIQENNKYPFNLIDSLAQIEYKENVFDRPDDVFSTENIFRMYAQSALANSNILFTNEYPDNTPFEKDKNNILSYYSPALFDITTKTNHSSINLYAECILRAIGIQKYGPSSLDSSIAVTKRFWKNEVGDLQGLRMTDGSGLSRSNLCTPLLFCKMLMAYTKRDNFNSFYSTIPIAGREGTVKNFAVGTAAENNARLKSGSMSRVKCYAGYVKGKNGKLYAVSIMFNNFEPDATVTAACAKLIGKVAELKGGKPKKEFVVNRAR